MVLKDGNPFSDVIVDPNVGLNLSDMFMNGSYNPITPGFSTFFQFSPTLYLDGFIIEHTTHGALLKADLSANYFEVVSNQNAGHVLNINLTNVRLFGQALSGGLYESETLDAFATQLGVQGRIDLFVRQADAANSKLADFIASGKTVSNLQVQGNFVTVPEPGSLILLGSGFFTVTTFLLKKKATR